jgi:hypothetical protein
MGVIWEWERLMFYLSMRPPSLSSPDQYAHAWGDVWQTEIHVGLDLVGDEGAKMASYDNIPPPSLFFIHNLADIAQN